VRIVQLTQWFDPEPSVKGLALARALHARGHEVAVVTGFPNYPGGRVYPGFKIRFRTDERIDGVRVIRVPLYPSHDRSSIGRVANYLSFASAAATIGVALSGPADVAYVYHPPATIAIAAWSLALLRRIPYVYDVQDLWPDTLASTGMIGSRAVLWAVGRWCEATYRMARAIVVLSPGFRRALVERGVPDAKIRVIPNWCEERSIQPGPGDPALARTAGLEGRFNIVFAGNMGPAQALDTVLAAASRIRASHPRVQFVLIGEGIDTDRLVARAAADGLDNVRFLPRCPSSEIGRFLNLADVLLVHLRDDPLFRMTIPSKTQTYLAAGRPILMAAGGDAADLIRRASAGVTCPPEDAGALAAAVADLASRPAAELDALGENGRRFYWQELAMDVGVNSLEAVLRSAARCRS
jgi:colanic acid biosynthesis glycosyl transferase WcaI